MMKFLIRASVAVAILALITSSGVFAQPMPQGVAPAMRTAAQPQDGVTVSAIGIATGSATSVLFTLNINSRDSSISAADLQPIIDALVASGVDRSSVHVPIYLQPTAARSNFVTISGSASQPTQAKLQQAMLNVSNVLAANQKLSIGNAQVTLRIDDCSAIADASRTDAIKRAHERALATAHDLGVKLGTVLSANISAPVDATGSCAMTYYIPNNMPPQGGDMFSVRVSTPVTIRYAIR